MLLLKGAPCAKKITEELRERILTSGEAPCLSIVRVGENPEDISYETGAVKRMEKCGITVRTRIFPKDVSEEEFLSGLSEINEDPGVNGILLFRPLPMNLSEEKAAAVISPEKDADCMNPLSMEKVFEGKSVSGPCTPQAVMEILDYYGIDISGKRAVVVGRSMVVGKPLAMMLLSRNATVTICHSKTEKLPEVCREADILITAIGRSRMITSDYVKPGATVIDVGINVDPEGNLSGDCDFDSVSAVAGALTPVPGGVGAVTTSVLAKHVTEAFFVNRSRVS